MKYLNPIFFTKKCSDFLLCFSWGEALVNEVSVTWADVTRLASVASVIIILSSLISLDSSKPIQHWISVDHEGLSTPITTYSRNNSSRNENAYAIRSTLQNNKNSEARSRILWLISWERTEEILWKKRRRSC